MQTVEDLAAMFERPAKTAALTGLPVDIRLTSDAAQGVAALLRMLGGNEFDREQTRLMLRLLMSRVGLFSIIKLWFAVRLWRLLAR